MTIRLLIDERNPGKFFLNLTGRPFLSIQTLSYRSPYGSDGYSAFLTAEARQVLSILWSNENVNRMNCNSDWLSFEIGGRDQLGTLVRIVQALSVAFPSEKRFSLEWTAARGVRAVDPMTADGVRAALTAAQLQPPVNTERPAQ